MLSGDFTVWMMRDGLPRATDGTHHGAMTFFVRRRACGRGGHLNYYYISNNIEIWMKIMLFLRWPHWLKATA